VLLRRFALAVFSLLALVGCGGPPEANARLVEARAAYAAAAGDEDLSALAPGALVEARRALEEAERAWRERHEAEVVEHYAYVVHQRIRLAEARLALRSVERAIDKARERRYRALLALQTAKAKAAARAADRAEAAEPEAEPSGRDLAPPRPVASGGDGLGAVLTRRGLVLTLPENAFNGDRATLRPETVPTIIALADFLNEYPGRRVQVEAFGEASGSRAEAVRAALIERGIAPARASTVSYEDAGGSGQSLRVEIVISGPRGVIPDRE
jgi:outer membrane protein OmpA-like peptidoglycan-associated protein